MSKQDRKYIKTKFEGVFYRVTARKDVRTGEPDRIYAFWYADFKGAEPRAGYSAYPMLSMQP